jgi:hypothetical protein
MKRRQTDDLTEDYAARKARLAADRQRDDLDRDDALARRRAEVAHEIALTKARGQEDEARLVADLTAQHRREARADAEAAADTARWQRELARTGARLRSQSAAQRSIEHRLLLKARIRMWALGGLGAALVAAVAWSTAGVRDGVLYLWGLAGHRASDAMEVVAWVAEPAMIGVVAALMVLRTLLPLIGGKLSGKLKRVEWALLGLSIAINAIPALAAVEWAGGVAAVAVGLLATAFHATPAVLVVLLAWTFGQVADAIGKARPETADGVAWLHDLGVTTITATDGPGAAPQRPGAVDDATAHAEHIRALLTDPAAEERLAEEARQGAEDLADYLARHADTGAVSGVAVLERPEGADPAGTGADQGEETGAGAAEDAVPGGAPSPAGDDGGESEERVLEPHQAARAQQGEANRNRVLDFIRAHEQGADVETRVVARALGLSRSTVREHRRVLRERGHDV